MNTPVNLYTPQQKNICPNKKGARQTFSQANCDSFRNEILNLVQKCLANWIISPIRGTNERKPSEKKKQIHLSATPANPVDVNLHVAKPWTGTTTEASTKISPKLHNSAGWSVDPPEYFRLTSFCLPASLLWRFRQSRTIPHTKPCWPFRKAQDVRRTTCNAWWQCLASFRRAFRPKSLCRQKAMAEVKTGHAHNASSSCMRLHLFGMLDVLLDQKSLGGFKGLHP